MFGASDPPTASVCVLPHAHASASPSLPLLPPLQRCLPQRTAGSSHISNAALLHIAPITDYSLLPPLLDLKFGEVERHHFSLLSSVSNMILARHKYCMWHQFSQKNTLFEYLSIKIQFQPSVDQKAYLISLKLSDTWWCLTLTLKQISVQQTDFHLPL